MIIIYLKIIYNIFYMLRISKNTYRVVRNINQSDDSSILLEFYRWLCAIVKRWCPILEESFKFAGVLWLLEWTSCEKLCIVGKINQYASEWLRLFECVFFNIFFKPETELVVVLLRWSLHPLLVYMVYRNLYESDSSPCVHSGTKWTVVVLKDSPC
jgi:hypothetical protein